MNQCFKVIHSIWQRLFDHKVFLHGEIQFTLREYEQLRNDIEVEYLFSLLEKVTESKGTQIDRLKEGVDTLHTSVDLTLKASLDICNKIIDLEDTYKQDPALDIAKQSRNLEWNKFVDNMSEECTKIDIAFEQKEKEIAEVYENLQNKLSITKID